MLRPFQVICICYRHSAESYGYQLRDDSRRHTALALLWHHFIVHNRGPLHTMQAVQATLPAAKCETETCMQSVGLVAEKTIAFCALPVQDGR